jgi:hypothetical protein
MATNSRILVTVMGSVKTMPNTSSVPDADASRAEAEKRQESFWLGVSDRTRSMCLGSLVLVWGIFSQKKDEAILQVSSSSKVLLLAVALFSVVVVGIDLVEYLASFQKWRALSGQFTILPKLKYDGIQNVSRVLKVALGLLTLILLCIVIGHILFLKVAYGQNPTALLGHWCGGEAPRGEYICVLIEAPKGPLSVKLTYQGRQGWIECSRLSFKGNALEALCGQAKLLVKAQSDDSSRVEATLTIHTWESKRTLKRFG